MANMIMKYSDAELINFVSNLNAIKVLNVAINASMRSGLFVGAAATIGGLLLGPRGIAIGSLLGGLGTSYAMNGTFKSVPDVLKNDLNKIQTASLASSIRQLITVRNVMSLAVLMTDQGFQDAVVMLVRNFLKKVFDYKI